MPNRIHTLSAIVACAGALAATADQAHLSAAPFEDRRPRLQASALSLYGTAADYRRTLDVRAVLEWPLSERSSVLGGLRRQSRAANGEYDAFRMSGWGFEAALRRHPWDWMPGFFFQAVAGMDRTEWVNTAHDPKARTFWPGSPRHSRDASVTRATRLTREGGLGYGYVWMFGRLTLEMQGILGPFTWSETGYARGTETDGSSWRAEASESGWDSVLRFRDLRIGFRF